MNRSPSELTPEAIRRLTENTEPWMSCDDCFDAIDTYVEGLLDGSDEPSDALRVHLVGCSACFEEASALVLMAADERRINHIDALTRLHDDLDLAMPADATRAGRRTRGARHDRR